MKGLPVTPDQLQAYAEGRKTIMRRLDGLKKINQHPDDWACYVPLNRFLHISGDRMDVKSPHQVGEVVYLKEAWAVDPNSSNVVYKSDIGAENTKTFIFGGYRWRSPLSMPAWAARHFQRITAVRPERLWEITPDEAVAEGFGALHWDCMHSAVENFRSYWNSLYPRYSWARNPWVFVITSEKVDRPVEAQR